MDKEWVGKVGETAGKVWRTLNNTGGATFSTIKKSIRETDSTVHEALGWLAREGKIDIETRGKSRVYRLNGQ